MLVDVQVAPGLDAEIEQPVVCKQREHVIEESDARIDLRPAGAVQVQGQFDVRFVGFAGDGDHELALKMA